MAQLLLYHLIPRHFQGVRKTTLDTLITDGHLQANISSPVLKDDSHQGVVPKSPAGSYKVLRTLYM